MNGEGAVTPVPSPGACVICVHGHRPMVGSMRLLARSLERAGYRTFSPRYDSMRLSLADIVETIRPEMTQFVRDTGGPVHFVGHSLGGLVIRALLDQWRPRHFGRVVMIGTPSGGSEWADLCVRLRLQDRVLGPVRAVLVTRRAPEDQALFGPPDYPLGVIAGRSPFQDVIPTWILPQPNDGTVSVAATHVAGETDHIVLSVTHAVMPANWQVQRQARAFLQSGRFAR